MVAAAAALSLWICTGCEAIKVSPAMNQEFGNIESISTDVYPRSRSIFGEVYGLKRKPETNKPALTEEQPVTGMFAP